MRLNEHIAISTPQILLVPYDAHHVVTYHEWMQDPVRADHSDHSFSYLVSYLLTHLSASPKAVQEATASEPLTLEEEFENQQSWRTSHDKLTFIVCKPHHHDAAVPAAAAAAATSGGAVNGGIKKAAADPPVDVDVDHPTGEQQQQQQDGDGGGRRRRRRRRSAVCAGEADAPARMLGDVNLFLIPREEDEDEDEGDDESGAGERQQQHALCDGEVDIMIADPAHRGRGAGKAAVRALLAFLRRHLDAVLEEYAVGGRQGGEEKGIGGESSGGGGGGGDGGRVRLKDLVVKIKADNEGSIALFRSLGFRQTGEVNYFGEIRMLLEGFGDGDGDGDGEKGVLSEGEGEVGGYQECFYDRSRLG
ncbi:acetyltransferase domain-containing protein [Biscogniauxia mediterranea]|nr:acetyltransferase domain-containing protein [Biscogniauxia mediterranea]